MNTSWEITAYAVKRHDSSSIVVFGHYVIDNNSNTTASKHVKCTRHTPVKYPRHHTTPSINRGTHEKTLLRTTL